MSKSRTQGLWEYWHYFNEEYFNGRLNPPQTIRLSRSTHYDGILYTWYPKRKKEVIRISVHASDMVGTLLHEMIHQYQAQVLRDLELGHDGAFRCFAKYLEQQTGHDIR